MAAFQRRVMLIVAALIPALSAGWTAAGADAPNKALPTVVSLADDNYTRGDWIGTYGSYAYVLCGMRFPGSLYGGAVIRDTGPQAVASSAPSELDRSVLLEPNGLKRTPAAWTDRASATPQGRNRNLYFKVDVPKGSFLLSLYFFEMGWPQYRAYRVRVLTDEAKPVRLAATNANNFLKGKYKRFVVLGPAQLLVAVERRSGPDAQVSGVFLDRLEAPDTPLWDSVVAGPIMSSPSRIDSDADVAAAATSAEDALTRLLVSPEELPLQVDYVRQETAFLRAMQEWAQKEPDAYYRKLASRWGSAEERTRKALSVMHGNDSARTVGFLRYGAALGHCNYDGARQAIGAVAEGLSDEARAAGRGWPRAAQLLQDCATALMERGRRAEAEIVLRAFSAVCLDLEPGAAAKEKLLVVGKLALKASVPLPVAEALREWERRNGSLPTDEQLLLGNLYYVAGKNDLALAMYAAVEPRLNQGRPHRWLLIAMMTAHLRENRVGEAMSIMNRLNVIYPNAAELDEARYRLGAHYFDVRELDKARQCFTELRGSTLSIDLQRMSNEYLGRIEQLAKLTTR